MRSAAVVGARNLFGGRAEVLAPVSRRARLERAAATRRPAHRNDRVDDARRGAGANDPEGRGEPAPSPRRVTSAPRPTAQRVRQARHRRRELRWPRRPPLRRRRRPLRTWLARGTPESCMRPAAVAVPVPCVSLIQPSYSRPVRAHRRSRASAARAISPARPTSRRGPFRRKNRPLPTRSRAWPSSSSSSSSAGATTAAAAAAARAGERKVT